MIDLRLVVESCIPNIANLTEDICDTCILYIDNQTSLKSIYIGMTNKFSHLFPLSRNKTEKSAFNFGTLVHLINMKLLYNLSILED